jgi:hypothetical protein
MQAVTADSHCTSRVLPPASVASRGMHGIEAGHACSDARPHGFVPSASIAARPPV